MEPAVVRLPRRSRRDLYNQGSDFAGINLDRSLAAGKRGQYKPDQGMLKSTEDKPRLRKSKG